MFDAIDYPVQVSPHAIVAASDIIAIVTVDAFRSSFGDDELALLMHSSGSANLNCIVILDDDTFIPSPHSSATLRTMVQRITWGKLGRKKSERPKSIKKP